MKILKTPLLLALLFSAAAAHAQVTGNTLQINDAVTFGLSPDPGSFEWRDNGIFIAKGISGQGSLLSTDAGSGARFLWHPGKAALRAGIMNLNETNIGTGSVALGSSTVASGQNSFATGWGSTASGAYAVAIGGTSYGAPYGNMASGEGSASVGGFFNIVSGPNSGTFGGWNNIVTGINSFASGVVNYASANDSVVFGWVNRAESSNVFVIGRNNVGGFTNNNNGNPNDDGDTQWIETDPLFEIGNGSGSGGESGRSNALTVYKNGSAVFQGVVRVAPGGDIPMYSGN